MEEVVDYPMQTSDRNTYRTNLQKRLTQYQIPEHMHHGVIDYVTDGHPVGNFLGALLSNDLRSTFNHADDYNKERISNWIAFLWNCVPSACWGSPNAVAKWQKNKGLFGEKNNG